MNNLYNDNDIKIMKASDNAVEMYMNRIDQIKNFAQAANYKTIGIAHCITFGYEVDIIKRYLNKYFKVHTVDCKIDRLKSRDLFGGNSSRVLCNPSGQAEYLNDKKCDLNISVGLCVGHDMIFNSKSDAPVTCLYTKDFTNNNDIDQAVSAINNKL